MPLCWGEPHPLMLVKMMNHLVTQRAVCTTTRLWRNPGNSCIMLTRLCDLVLLETHFNNVILGLIWEYNHVCIFSYFCSNIDYGDLLELPH